MEYFLIIYASSIVLSFVVAWFVEIKPNRSIVVRDLLKLILISVLPGVNTMFVIVPILVALEDAKILDKEIKF